MVAFYWVGTGRYAIVCWQDNDPGNYEIYCTTFMPLLGEGDLKVEESPIVEDKSFEVFGRVVVLRKEGSIYDVSGKIVGKGGRISLKPGIYFVEAGGKVQKIVIR